MLKRVTSTAAMMLLVFLASHTSFAQDAGADIFKTKCAMCHGEDGLAKTPISQALGVPSYKSPDVLKMSDADLTTVINDGKDNKMPAFKGQLTDAQIADVLHYIHTLQKKE